MASPSYVYVILSIEAIRAALSKIYGANSVLRELMAVYPEPAYVWVALNSERQVTQTALVQDSHPVGCLPPWTPATLPVKSDPLVVTIDWTQIKELAASYEQLGELAAERVAAIRCHYIQESIKEAYLMMTINGFNGQEHGLRWCTVCLT